MFQKLSYYRHYLDCRRLLRRRLHLRLLLLYNWFRQLQQMQGYKLIRLHHHHHYRQQQDYHLLRHHHQQLPTLQQSL
jgi:hypothetical protein